ncbi:hypothetical protein [Streptomyces sp. NPDC059631]|uniref:hypothetical protein n=1 Tax=unclassified Streptomyces TaxID=2593676 RepID=UPI00369C53D7
MPKLAAIAANVAAGLLQLIGVTIMLTTRATGATGTADTAGLTLTTIGFVLGAATTGPAVRAVYIWSRDRGYRLYHEHQAQDAAIPLDAAVVPFSRTGTH